MRALLILCACALLLGIADLPIEYYTFLRIGITIGAMVVIFSELKNGFNFWILAFGVIAIIFNPLVPIYLLQKEVWIPLDILASILFLVKAFVKRSV